MKVSFVNNPSGEALILIMWNSRAVGIHSWIDYCKTDISLTKSFHSLVCVI